MSKSNPVNLWRFGRTVALILTQKWLNRAKTGVLHALMLRCWCCRCPDAADVLMLLENALESLHRTCRADPRPLLASLFSHVEAHTPMSRRLSGKRPGGCQVWVPPCCRQGGRLRDLARILHYLPRSLYDLPRILHDLPRTCTSFLLFTRPWLAGTYKGLKMTRIN